jgi:prepilin-type N-terminal cleavage/methylation domain-containing protein
MESPRLRPLVRSARGFTLAEMLICIAIIGIITAVAVTGQSTFNQSLLLNDTSYTVALSAREAQSLGLSSRKFAGVQNGGYGLDFTKGSPTTYYTVFADVIGSLQGGASEPSWCPIIATTTPEAKAGNCLYDGVNETFQRYDLTGGYTIGDFCGKNGSGLQCAGTGAIQSLDVLYLRPNTSAIIKGITPGGGQVQYSCAQVSIQSPSGGNVQTIMMTQLGEVAVGQTCS